MRLRRIATTGLLAALAGTCAGAAEPVDLAVTTTDGHPFRLADQRGRWLLVNYWATWCGSCIAEMPALSRLADREPRLVVLGLTDETLSAASLQAFLTAHPVHYPVAVVDRASLPAALPATAFGVGMRPLSYLVAPDGTVVDRFIGELDINKLEARVRSLSP